MPILMQKDDRLKAESNLRTAENVWYENISSDSDNVYLPLPGRGSYQVILVRTDPTLGIVKTSPIRIGTKEGVWRIPTEEEDRAMDEEIAASFDLDG